MLSDYKKEIVSLKNQVSSLSNELALLKGNQVPTDVSDSSLPDDSQVSISSADKHIKTMFNDYINEEKEKAKRRLNIIIHNIPESASEDGNTRKKHDTDFVTDICQQHLNTKVSINKCFRIGKKGAKPRLLKISLGTELEKAIILHNCTKLRDPKLLPVLHKVFITPDLTPKGRESNKNLRAQLKEMNKGSRQFQIKKRPNSGEEEVILDPTSHTDNYPMNISYNTRNPTNQLLKSFVINFQSIMAKKAEFHNLINDHHPDIIFGNETWLSPNVNTAEFLPKEYNIFRQDRSDGYGGVLLAFQSTLNVIEYPLVNTYKCEIVAATLMQQEQKTIICSIYRPPATDSTYLQNLIFILKDLIHANPTTPIWIGGDLNLPNIEWSTNTIIDNRYPLILCDQILDFVTDYGFLQLVQSPTRNNNTLDIFFTNQPSFVESCEVIPGISDHEIVSIISLTSISHS